MIDIDAVFHVSANITSDSSIITVVLLDQQSFNVEDMGSLSLVMLLGLLGSTPTLPPAVIIVDLVQEFMSLPPLILIQMTIILRSGLKWPQVQCQAKKVMNQKLF